MQPGTGEKGRSEDSTERNQRTSAFCSSRNPDIRRFSERCTSQRRTPPNKLSASAWPSATYGDTMGPIAPIGLSDVDDVEGMTALLVDAINDRASCD